MLKVKYYNGKLDNYDHNRPKTGNICHAANKERSADIQNRYVLVNILVNNGKHDTYVLKNLKTGKIRKSLYIVVIS